MRRLYSALAIALTLPTCLPACTQQPAFSVATIRPSAADVKFEHDGAIEFHGNTLSMRDVTVDSCIKWAYGVQNSQIAGPAWMDSDHFDITAKSDGPARDDQMKEMLQSLLAERFGLAFHHEQREMKALVLSVVSSGAKLNRQPRPTLHPSIRTPPTVPSQNQCPFANGLTSSLARCRCL